MKSFLVCVLTLLFSGASAQEVISYWKFRKVVTVRNKAAYPLEDYQVFFEIPSDSLVMASKIKPDKSDARVVDSDLMSPLCFWIENSEPGKAVKVWVKIPRLGPKAVKNIYFLYGNAQARPAGSPECTFMLFDDFNGMALDRNKWELLGKEEPEVKDGTVRFSASEADQFIRSFSEYDRPLIAEMKVNKARGKFLSFAQLIRSDFGWIHGYSLILSSADRYMQIYKMEPSVCGAYELPYPHSIHTASGSVTGVWSLTFITDNNIMASWPGGDIIEGNVYNDAEDMKIGLGVLACNSGSRTTGELEVDWVRIRQFNVNEPSVEVGVEEKIDQLLPSDETSPFLAGIIRL